METPATATLAAICHRKGLTFLHVTRDEINASRAICFLRGGEPEQVVVTDEQCVDGVVTALEAALEDSP